MSIIIILHHLVFSILSYLIDIKLNQFFIFLFVPPPHPATKVEDLWISVQIKMGQDQDQTILEFKLTNENMPMQF